MLVLISRDERECILFVYLLVDVSFFFSFSFVCFVYSGLIYVVEITSSSPENSTGNGNAVMSQAVIHPGCL